MNFATFYAEIISSVFPDKDSPRLARRHRNAVFDALTRIQRFAKCYQFNHKDIIRQDDTSYVGGVSVFNRVPGAPWEVRIERLDARQDFVLAQPYTFAQMRALMETKGSCVQDVQCEPYGYYGDYTYPGECAPASVCVPSSYAVALDDTSMYLYPAVHVCTQVVVHWKGIKRSWGDEDLIPWEDEDGFVDRDVMQAVEYFLHYESMLKDNCDPEKAASFLALHMNKVAELNMICSRRHEVVGPPILFPWAASARSTCILNESTVDDGGNPVTPGPRPEVATPTFSPPGGNYQTGPTVAILCATPDVRIHYTGNGTIPTPNSAQYSEPLLINNNVTLKAIAYKDGYRDSQVGQASYSITLPTVATPVVSPPTGSYVGTVTSVITCATPGVTMFYTEDGTAPTFASKRYTGPILVPTSRKITCIAIKTGMSNSQLGFAIYTITASQVATPIFSPSPGTYYSAQAISIVCPTPLATIHYTLNDDPPTPLSPTYNGPLTLPMYGVLNIKAIAVRGGMDNSLVAEGLFQAVLAPPVVLYDKTPPLDATGSVGETTYIITFDYAGGVPSGTELWFNTGIDTVGDPGPGEPGSTLYDFTPGTATGLNVSSQFKARSFNGIHSSTVTLDAFAVVLPVYSGTSSNPTLDAAEIKALPNRNLYYHWEQIEGTFIWGPPKHAYPVSGALYFYIAWDATYKSPAAGTGFNIGGTALPMESGAPYNFGSENGWSYAEVVIDGNSYHVYRSNDPLTFPTTTVNVI